MPLLTSCSNPVEPTTNFPKQELAIGQFWKENRIYEKSLAQRADAPPFVFYEGPPTANGMPHPGHCLTRAIKDLFPRYRTMRGYRCERKAGWDTHGLPVEVEVCKELGIHSKEEIEAYGIEPFIQKCQQSVWRYMQEWERLTERIGFWVDLKNAYVTYHQSYVESVWWSLKESVRPRAALPGPQNRLVVGPRRHGALRRRSGARLSLGGGSERVCEVSTRSTTTAKLDRRHRCWSGRRRPGRCRAINSSPCIRISSTPYVVLDARTANEQLDRCHRIWSKHLRNKTKQELPKLTSRSKARDLIGRRYLPPFDYYYKHSRYRAYDATSMTYVQEPRPLFAWHRVQR